MKINKPLPYKFPIKVNNQIELIKFQRILNECGYKWRHETNNELWRTDFRDNQYPLELRLFENDNALYTLKEITIHKSEVYMETIYKQYDYL